MVARRNSVTVEYDRLLNEGSGMAIMETLVFSTFQLPPLDLPPLKLVPSFRRQPYFTRAEHSNNL